MRYRRLSYRYALVVATQPGWPYGDDRQADLTGPRFAHHYWRPAADICESADAIEVIIELAGVDQDAIDIVLFDDALIVEGLRHLAASEPSGIYHLAEVRQGPFRLELALPAAVDLNGVDARYEQGLLRITFPKPAPAGRR